MEQVFFIYIVIIISAVWHEYAHGLAAKILGDDTAERAGRLTLNPLVHIDPFGTVLLPLLLMFSTGIFIGWAKPVPYNPYNLSDKKYGNLKVAIAGPLANLVIAIVLGLVLRFIGVELFTPVSYILVQLIIYINIVLVLFNLIPVPPLDGSKVLADLWPAYWRIMPSFGVIGIIVALLVAFQFLPGLSQGLFHIITGSYFNF